MQRRTLTRIGTGMPSQDMRNYRTWKAVTTVTAGLSIIGIVFSVAAVVLHTPMLALVAPAALVAYMVAKRERDALSEMLKIRFTAAMNLHCGIDDEPWQYSRTEA